MEARRETYDLILRNGRVIDPANGLDEFADVAIRGGKIARIEAGIAPGSADKEADVKGGYVIPGIVDIHAHIYPLLPMAPECLGSIDADAHMVKVGVTTAVDAGSVGWRDFLNFKERVIDKAQTRVLAFLNIACKGMIDMRSEQSPADMQPKVAAEVARAYPELIVGIKAAHYWPGPKPFDAEHPPWASVDRAVEAAELSGTRAMIDFQPNHPDSPYKDLVLKHMRAGDIHTHVFARHFPTVDADGKVYDYMRRARENGVLFDVGHGAGSFWFRNGVRAIRDGFPPDTISTDMHTASVRGPALSMLHVMSKFLNMGMPLYEVIERSTVLPALKIGRDDLGTLSVGACADVAVIRKLEGDFGYVDNGYAKLSGTCMLDCLMTVRGGKPIYDGYGLTMPEWTDAPQAYWDMPAHLR